MPSITLVVPGDLLANPRVARALADLALALGGHHSESTTPKAPPVPAAGPTEALRATSTAPTLPVPPPADATLRVRWDAYVAGLATAPRQFLTLLEKRGRLTLDEAVEALSLPGGKALGGILGSIGRWTPVAGFKLPYVAEGERSSRSWIWMGIAA